MKYSEAKEIFEAMNFSLSREELIAIENAEETLANISVIEAFVDKDKIKEATNKAVEASKKIIEKIKEAFHKLVIKFGLIVRNIQHRAQARKIMNEMNYLGDINLEVPSVIVNNLKKVYGEAGIENSWQVPTDGSGGYVVPMAYVRRELKPLLSKAVEIDEELSDYLRNPSPTIDTKALRTNASKCSAAINATINFLNVYVNLKKADYIASKMNKNKKDGTKNDKK